jgi:hypothetical protein
VESDRTFFCSELIAKAFKILGVIEDDETSCTMFYPHHFTEKGDSSLKLTPDTTIGPEMQIILNKVNEDEEDDKTVVLLQTQQE